MAEIAFPIQRLLSFKEIDTLHQRPKGTSFRAFKGLSQQLLEGEHYYYLNAQSHAAEIEALRREGRIYSSTVHAVLLTPVGYELIQKALETKP
jgi:hypothetical protein